MKIIERTHNLQTNEIIDLERDATIEEIAEIKKAEQEAKAEAAARAEAETKRAALLAKLGITEEEAKLLLS